MIPQMLFEGEWDLADWWDNTSQPVDRRAVLRKAGINGEGMAMWESFGSGERRKLLQAANALVLEGVSVVVDA